MEKLYNEQTTTYLLFGKFKIFETKRITREALEDDITQVQHFVSPAYYKEEFEN